MTTDPLSYRRIFWFWLPLAGTWLMMAVEGPYLAAIIARLPDPTVNLAAFGVAFAVAIIIEAPVIMLMGASTKLVEDRASYLVLRRFGYGLSALLTVVQLVTLIPPVFDLVTRQLLGLPDEVARLTYGGLALLVPWPAAIGYRRFKQGLLIRHHLTRRVAYGTGIRLVTMSATAFVAYRLGTLEGAHIGALALSTGVVVEAVASKLMTRGIVPELMTRVRAPERLDDIRLGRVTAFYVPLALTSVLAMAVQPMVTFFMGQSRLAIESLAVLPVIHGLTFVFRAIGLSYMEVVIALAGDHRQHVTQIRNFAAVLALGSAGGLAAIALTPLAHVWFRDISGLTPELTRVALTPIRILAVFPAMSVALAVERGLLVHAHRTASITWATLLEVVTVGTLLAIGIHVADLVGAVAAATAILGGRVVGNLYLLPACLRVLRGDAPTVDEPRPAAAVAD